MESSGIRGQGWRFCGQGKVGAGVMRRARAQEICRSAVTHEVEEAGGSLKAYEDIEAIKAQLQKNKAAAGKRQR